MSSTHAGCRVLQGMDFTTDKLRSLVRKWQTLIEAHVDVKTTDGYLLRLFCISFTMKRPGQIKKTCYAQTSQVHIVCSMPASLCSLLLLMRCWLACVGTYTARAHPQSLSPQHRRSAPSARRWWRSCSGRRRRAI